MEGFALAGVYERKLSELLAGCRVSRGCFQRELETRSRWPAELSKHEEVNQDANT